MKTATKKEKNTKKAKYIDKLYFENLRNEIRILSASYNKITSFESKLTIEISSFIFTDYELACLSVIVKFLKSEYVNFSIKTNYLKQRLTIKLIQIK